MMNVVQSPTRIVTAPGNSIAGRRDYETANALIMNPIAVAPINTNINNGTTISLIPRVASLTTPINNKLSDIVLSSSSSSASFLVEEEQKKQQKAQQKQKKDAIIELLRTIHPTDYTISAFRSNGCTDTDEVVQRCFERFVFPPTSEQLNEYGSSEIVAAVRSNDIEMAKRLWSENKFTNCNACNRFGESILHIACRRGKLNMIKFFIVDVGLRIDTIRDDYHRTPIHDVFWTASDIESTKKVVDFLLRTVPETAELLLVKDVRGYTPLDYARAEHRGKWLHFLWERKSLLRPSPSTISSIAIKEAATTPTPTAATEVVVQAARPRVTGGGLVGPATAAVDRSSSLSSTIIIRNENYNATMINNKKIISNESNNVENYTAADAYDYQDDVDDYDDYDTEEDSFLSSSEDDDEEEELLEEAQRHKGNINIANNNDIKTAAATMIQQQKQQQQPLPSSSSSSTTPAAAASSSSPRKRERH